MIVFEKGIDYRARTTLKPTVAKFNILNNEYEYCVIGTDYGYIHTSGGNVRTWKSYSGAYKYMKQYEQRNS